MSPWFRKGDVCSSELGSVPGQLCYMEVSILDRILPACDGCIMHGSGLVSLFFVENLGTGKRGGREEEREGERWRAQGWNGWLVKSLRVKGFD